MLAGKGVGVVLADLSSSPASDLAAELTDAGHQVVAHDTDVREAAQLERAAGRAAELGALRVVVCCAGIATPGRLLGRRGPLDLQTAHQVVEVNLLGTMNTVAEATKVMADVDPYGSDDQRGVIVMTASAAAQDGQIGQVAYAASKAGVAGMTLPAARDLAGRGIRVMTIAPGTFDTSMMAGLGEQVRESLAAQIPNPARLGHPDEYAQLVEHIIANPMLNGETIRLDGALRMPPR